MQTAAKYDAEKSLTWNLEQLGIRHEPGTIYGKRRLLKDAEFVGEFTADEGWAFVRRAHRLAA